MADLGALLAATDADSLHRALVLHPPALQEREPLIAIGLFRSAHDCDAAGAVVTAMLLMTDSRWSATARSLAIAIEATAIVPGDDLDLLAQTFVLAEESIYWSCPSEWFDGPEIVVAIDDDATEADLTRGDDDGSGEVLVTRAVPAGLRRWAAGRMLRSNPSCWGPIFHRATSAGESRGGAVMLGLLDERARLPEPAVEFIDHAACNWGRKDVRAAARRPPIPLAEPRAGELPEPPASPTAVARISGDDVHATLF